MKVNHLMWVLPWSGICWLPAKWNKLMFAQWCHQVMWSCNKSLQGSNHQTAVDALPSTACSSWWQSHSRGSCPIHTRRPSHSSHGTSCQTHQHYSTTSTTTRRNQSVMTTLTKTPLIENQWMAAASAVGKTKHSRRMQQASVLCSIWRPIQACFMCLVTLIFELLNPK